MKTILVTGGAGYIGSHTVVDLLENDYNVLIIDNYSNSSPRAVNSIESITSKKIKVYNFDIRNREKLKEVFINNNIDGVINFAGFKAVGESVENPLMYYDNNLYGMITLLEIMEEFEVYNLVFSSSATVYGIPESIPMNETDPISGINPYARTKRINEEILQDISLSNNRWNIISLRYFNPLGAHESGNLGEDPNGIPNNLAPFITQVAIGRRSHLNIFGVDYDTSDGTCIRDYVHINDLAKGHRQALDKLFEASIGFQAINLGSGKGYSVFDILRSFEKVVGKEIPFEITDRRPGDIDESVASIEKAKKFLGWEPRFGIERMCADSWKWQQKNPNGFH